jgi:excinuclease UvrABC ATPase subunit
MTDVFDRIKARNDALWNALTNPSVAVRVAEFERAFSDAPEQCPACKGTGAEASGTSYGGQHEMLACDKCDGSGVALHPAAKALTSRVVIGNQSHEEWCPKIRGADCQCVPKRTTNRENVAL